MLLSDDFAFVILIEMVFFLFQSIFPINPMNLNIDQIVTKMSH